MKHYGDITKINGTEVEVVDVVVGGSPCQDLSVAGKRAGLAGERSGLFMEQIRVIKEMRENDRRIKGSTVDIRHISPRYMVWENVPGALSSGDPKGEDFRIVLEETARVADPTAVIPRLEGGNKWSNAGCILANGWSIAWRIHDGQFFGKTIRDRDSGDVLRMGTPQRRRRLALVADFGGQTAPEILFERKGLSGHPEPGEPPWQGTPEGAEGSIGSTGESYTLKIRGGREVDSNGKKAGKGALIQTEKAGTVSVTQDQTLISIDRGGGRGGVNLATEQTPSLTTTHDGAHAVFTIEGNGARGSHHGDGYAKSETSYTLNTIEQHAVCAVAPENRGGQRPRTETDDVIGALCARDYKGVGSQYVNEGKLICSIQKDGAPNS